MFSPVINFFYNWYVDDTRNFWNWFINYLKMFDRSIGLVGNIQNWASPLFGDYSYIGVVVGPVMRTFRIIMGVGIFAIITFFSLAIYLFWIILPIAVIIMVASNLLAFI